MKVQSIDRVFDILEQLSSKSDGLNLTEISQQLKLPTSTVYRLLSVLRARNYVEKNDETNRYKLGLGFVDLTSSFLSSLELKTEAHPFLRNLSNVTGQVVFMGIEQDGDVVYIDRYDQYNDHRKYCMIGSRMPLFCTALGKTLLMEFRDEDIRELYTTKDMSPLTEHSITDIDELISIVRLNRTRGFSDEVEENTVDQHCVAAPIFDYRGNIIAAASTSWNIRTQDHLHTDRIIELVKETGRNISIRMGWTGSYPVT